MVKFVRNIILFILPLLIISGFALIFYNIVKETGELNSIIKSAEEQRENHNCIIGLGYNEQTSYYKLLNANYYEAPIISLGTSRVMQFKKNFFLIDFYNCGGAVGGNYNEYKNFLENLKYEPKTMILGLDVWVFNNAWNKDCDKYNSFQEINEIDRETIPLMKAIFKDWVSKKWTIKDLKRYPNNIGFNGRVKDNGFLYDGSYYYGDLYRDPTSSADYEFIDTKNRISEGVQRFEWGEHIDKDTLRQLNNLLSYCRNKEIVVIGFLAPFAPSVYDMMNKSGHYGYLDEIVPSCIELFDEYGFEFYDYMDGQKLSLTDDYFLDGFHGSDIVYGRVLTDMAKNNSSIKEYIDSDHINELINNAYSEYVFEDPFIRSGISE